MRMKMRSTSLMRTRMRAWWKRMTIFWMTTSPTKRAEPCY